MAATLDSSILNQLNTAEAKSLHELTFNLSSCGVGKIVNLPQIIVVGEQSAGKSSVLEAISRVRFPVKGDVCTRFATEIVLRHATKTRADVSIQFTDKSKPPHSFQKVDFSEDDLPAIINDAQDRMGLTANGREFSRDVLRLEIEGPSMYPLTLVDLPGLFQHDTADQSTKGRETVDQLVESYMKKTNSIILVVITARNQLANHVALRKVKEYDPKRERTLGIITKPDLTLAGYSDEKNYIQLAKNQESANKLLLGWHVLRNRAENEDSLETRDTAETAFFETTAWGSIPRDDRGVAALRKKLSRVLYNHIRNNLPNVIEDIEGKLRDRQLEVDRLGLPRSTTQEMRSFLLSISSEFQRLSRDGVLGHYNDAFFGDLSTTDKKLRAQLRNFNRAFDHVLGTKGSKFTIELFEDPGSNLLHVPEFLQNFLKRYPYDFPDPERKIRQEVSSALEKQAAGNQGCELPGSYNTDLVIQLFQQQAAPWEKIAEFHIKQIILVAKAFVDDIFQHVVGHPGVNPTTEAILCGCVDPFFAKKEKILNEKLQELLKPYTRGYALPLDAEFRRMATYRIVDRLADRLEALTTARNELGGENSAKGLRGDMLAEAASTLNAMEGGEFGTEKVIDLMQAYYEMSRRTFTDNVINLAIENCLICDLPDILTPTQVDKMGEEQLRVLSAEPEDATLRREQLHHDIEVLRQGLEQCQKYKPRRITVVPSSHTQVQVASPSTEKLFGSPVVKPSIISAPGTDSKKSSIFSSGMKEASFTSFQNSDNPPDQPRFIFGRKGPASSSAFAASLKIHNSDDPAKPISVKPLGQTVLFPITATTSPSIFSNAEISHVSNPESKQVVAGHDPFTEYYEPNITYRYSHISAVPQLRELSSEEMRLYMQQGKISLAKINCGDTSDV